MKKILAVLVLIFLPAASSQTQENTPSVAQCRANADVWVFGVDPTKITKVGISEITERMLEMMSCRAVDPPNSVTYTAVSLEYALVTNERQNKFLLRHKLMNQFIEDDKAGMR